MKQKPIYINGKPMPFTAKELIRILKIIKKSMVISYEKLSSKNDKRIMDKLLKELEDK